MNINGIDYKLIGFDEYLRQFEEVAKQEAVPEAESMLVEELENFESDVNESIRVVLDGERTKTGQPVTFLFEVITEDVGPEAAPVIYIGSYQ